MTTVKKNREENSSLNQSDKSFDFFQVTQITLIFHKLACYAQNYYFSFKSMKMYEEIHYLFKILKKKNCNASGLPMGPTQCKKQPVKE